MNFYIQLLVICFSAGCVSLKPDVLFVAQQKLPMISLYLEEFDRFRFVGGFKGASGMTHDVAVSLATTYCETNGGALQQFEWFAKPFDETGGENTIRIGTLSFKCGK